MRVDVYHDTVCPWCRIGKAHMKQALDQWTGEPVEVYYHAFYLNPNIPLEGYNFQEYMTAKNGGRVLPQEWFNRPREMGTQVGLTFNFERIEYMPNTTLSHQLIAATPPERRDTIIDAIYDAYFEHGYNIGNLDVLVDIAGAQGLDTQKIRKALEGNTELAAIQSDMDTAIQIGVTGVPFFVFNQRFAFSGAQPVSAFLQVMTQLTTKPE